jgi:hypothetical protein
MAHVSEHPRDYLDLIEGLPVVPEGPLSLAATFEVTEGPGRESPAGQPGQVFDVETAGQGANAVRGVGASNPHQFDYFRGFHSTLLSVLSLLHGADLLS